MLLYFLSTFLNHSLFSFFFLMFRGVFTAPKLHTDRKCTASGLFFRKHESCAATCQSNVCCNKVDVTHARTLTHRHTHTRVCVSLDVATLLRASFCSELAALHEKDKRGNPFVPPLLFTFIDQFIPHAVLSVRAAEAQVSNPNLNRVVFSMGTLNEPI